MGLQFTKPSALLSPFIKQYWTIENCMESGEQHIQRIVPNGLMELTFYFGDIPKSLHETRMINGNILVSGQQKDFYDLAVTGNLRMFSVSLKPQGAMMFFNQPLSELNNQNVPLSYLLKSITDKFENELFSARSFMERVRLAENFMLRQLNRSYKPYEGKRIDRSIGLIDYTKGNISVENLASDACLSRKQYERTFCEHVGITPKQFLRIVRFQHAIHLKSLNPSLPLTELTYLCGYYDQPHMINDFRSLSGITPHEFFAGGDTYSDYFSL